MTTTTNDSERTTRLLSLMKDGDDAFNARDDAAMRRMHHPDMIAHLTGSSEPTFGEPAHAAAMNQMLGTFPDTQLQNSPYTVSFGSGDWTATICSVKGTFSGELTMPDGTKVAPTGKEYHVKFCTIARWDGDRLTEEFVFWDSALQAQQIGLS